MNITSDPVDPKNFSHQQSQAAVGALIGAAVGDALGAPHEFKPAGTYLRHFSTPVLGGTGEMVGGGSFNWAPGEFTDDTQMAVALAEAIIATGGEVDLDRIWLHFQTWRASATDVGNTTARALMSPDRKTAAQVAHEYTRQSAGNGALMRVAPIGIAGVRWGRARTVTAAVEQAALTHLDPRAGWSAAIAAEAIRQLILGQDFESAIASALMAIPEDDHGDFELWLHPDWDIDSLDGESNGLATVCLSQAVWAIRNSSSFEEAVVNAVNLGDDADTVAAVTGALAGALYGVQQIPARWATYVNGQVLHPEGELRRYRHHDLSSIVHNLLGRSARRITDLEPIIPVTEVHDIGVHACNLPGAMEADPTMAVISLCKTEDTLGHLPYRRQFHLIDDWDDDQNPHLRAVTEDAVASIEAFLAEGREVVVHCHGGRSRTGFILKAWYMRRFGVSHQEAHDWIQAEWPHYATWNVDFFEFLDDEWSN